jgi:hypothetical protein
LRQYVERHPSSPATINQHSSFLELALIRHGPSGPPSLRRAVRIWFILKAVDVGKEAPIRFRSPRIYLRFVVFLLTLVSVIFAGAQNSEKRPSPPLRESEASPELSPSDPDATSQRNALATSDDQNSAAPLVRGPIHAESDNLPRSKINKLIVKMIMETTPKGGEFHASRQRSFQFQADGF